MTNKNQEFVDAALEQQEKTLQQLDRLLLNSRPDAVFGKPMAVGDSQVLTASETFSTLGFGFGVGGGQADETATVATPGDMSDDGPQPGGGAGGGGGGGGMTTGRPVAIVRIDAEGVTVEPVVDVTKIALAAFTALGTMFLMFSKMIKGAR
jgi:uncharacterized spore protein YtfJ